MSVSQEVLEGLRRDEYLRFADNARRLAQGSGTRSKAAKEAVATLEAMPLEALVVIAFRTDKVSVKERKLIEALDRNPGATSAALTSTMGWKSQAWHLHFGSMCRDRLADLIEPPVAENRSSDDEMASFYSGILADFDPETSGFTFKPEARRALVQAGVLPEVAPAEAAA
jgi:hypothetical protein